MAFEKKEMNDLIRILPLMLIALPWAASMNIDCGGKAFHCVNSTHFMICVDLGGGVSSTIDGFVIPCPPLTECRGLNHFECEFPVLTTPAPVTGTSVTMVNNSEISTVHEDIMVSTTLLADGSNNPLLGNDFNVVSTTTTPASVISNMEPITNLMAGINQSQNIDAQFETTSKKTIDIKNNYQKTSLPLHYPTEPTTAYYEDIKKSSNKTRKEETLKYSTSTDPSTNLINAKVDSVLPDSIAFEKDTHIYSNDGTTYDTTETHVTIRNQGVTESAAGQNKGNILDKNIESAVYTTSNLLFDTTETPFSIRTDLISAPIIDTTSKTINNLVSSIPHIANISNISTNSSFPKENLTIEYTQNTSGLFIPTISETKDQIRSEVTSNYNNIKNGSGRNLTAQNITYESPNYNKETTSYIGTPSSLSVNYAVDTTTEILREISDKTTGPLLYNRGSETSSVLTNFNNMTAEIVTTTDDINTDGLKIITKVHPNNGTEKPLDFLSEHTSSANSEGTTEVFPANIIDNLNATIKSNTTDFILKFINRTSLITDPTLREQYTVKPVSTTSSNIVNKKKVSVPVPRASLTDPTLREQYTMEPVTTSSNIVDETLVPASRTILTTEPPLTEQYTMRPGSMTSSNIVDENRVSVLVPSTSFTTDSTLTEQYAMEPVTTSSNIVDETLVPASRTISTTEPPLTEQYTMRPGSMTSSNIVDEKRVSVLVPSTSFTTDSTLTEQYAMEPVTTSSNIVDETLVPASRTISTTEPPLTEQYTMRPGSMTSSNIVDEKRVSVLVPSTSFTTDSTLTEQYAMELVSTTSSNIVDEKTTSTLVNNSNLTTLIEQYTVEPVPTTSSNIVDEQRISALVNKTSLTTDQTLTEKYTMEKGLTTSLNIFDEKRVSALVNKLSLTTDPTLTEQYTVEPVPTTSFNIVDEKRVSAPVNKTRMISDPTLTEQYIMEPGSTTSYNIVDENRVLASVDKSSLTTDSTLTEQYKMNLSPTTSSNNVNEKRVSVPMPTASLTTLTEQYIMEPGSITSSNIVDEKSVLVPTTSLTTDSILTEQYTMEPGLTITFNNVDEKRVSMPVPTTSLTTDSILTEKYIMEPGSSTPSNIVHEKSVPASKTSLTTNPTLTEQYTIEQGPTTSNFVDGKRFPVSLPNILSTEALQTEQYNTVTVTNTEINTIDAMFSQLNNEFSTIPIFSENDIILNDINIAANQEITTQGNIQATLDVLQITENITRKNTEYALDPENKTVHGQQVSGVEQQELNLQSATETSSVVEIVQPNLIPSTQHRSSSNLQNNIQIAKSKNEVCVTESEVSDLVKENIKNNLKEIKEQNANPVQNKPLMSPTSADLAQVERASATTTITQDINDTTENVATQLNKLNNNTSKNQNAKGIQNKSITFDLTENFISTTLPSENQAEKNLIIITQVIKDTPGNTAGKLNEMKNKLKNISLPQNWISTTSASIVPSETRTKTGLINELNDIVTLDQNTNAIQDKPISIDLTENWIPITVPSIAQTETRKTNTTKESDTSTNTKGQLDKLNVVPKDQIINPIKDAPMSINLTEYWISTTLAGIAHTETDFTPKTQVNKSNDTITHGSKNLDFSKLIDASTKKDLATARQENTKSIKNISESNLYVTPVLPQTNTVGVEETVKSEEYTTKSYIEKTYLIGTSDNKKVASIDTIPLNLQTIKSEQHINIGSNYSSEKMKSELRKEDIFYNDKTINNFDEFPMIKTNTNIGNSPGAKNVEFEIFETTSQFLSIRPKIINDSENDAKKIDVARIVDPFNLKHIETLQDTIILEQQTPKTITEENKTKNGTISKAMISIEENIHTNTANLLFDKSASTSTPNNAAIVSSAVNVQLLKKLNLSEAHTRFKMYDASIINSTDMTRDEEPVVSKNVISSIPPVISTMSDASVSVKPNITKTETSEVPSPEIISSGNQQYQKTTKKFLPYTSDHLVPTLPVTHKIAVAEVIDKDLHATNKEFTVNTDGLNYRTAARSFTTIRTATLVDLKPFNKTKLYIENSNQIRKPEAVNVTANTRTLNVGVQNKQIKTRNDNIGGTFTTKVKTIMPEKINASQIENYCYNKSRGRYSDRHDCTKFYICIGKLAPIVGKCPANTVFSDVRKQCTRNMAHCIRESEFKCVNEGRFSDIIKENVYYICIKKTNNFIRFKFQCQSGYYLNKTSVKCIKHTDLESLHQSSVSSDNISKSEKTTLENAKSSKAKNSKYDNKSLEEFECEEEGKFSDPNDCRAYYLCKKNKKSEFRRKRKLCDTDEVFHKNKKKCVDDESYEC